MNGQTTLALNARTPVQQKGKAQVTRREKMLPRVSVNETRVCIFPSVLLFHCHKVQCQHYGSPQCQETEPRGSQQTARPYKKDIVERDERLHTVI